MHHQSLVSLMALGLLGAGAAGQLTEQCDFVGFSDGTASRPVVYTAKCSRVAGGTADICSRLNLSHCLTNRNGELGAPAGADTASFKETCPHCHVGQSGQKLFCLCQRTDRLFNYASVELDSIISVREGVLACATTAGRTLSECPVTRIGPPPGPCPFVA